VNLVKVEPVCCANFGESETRELKATCVFGSSIVIEDSNRISDALAPSPVLIIADLDNETVPVTSTKPLPEST